MISYNSGTAFGNGSTGKRVVSFLDALGFTPQPGLGLVVVETRIERPAGLPPEAEFIPLAAPLDKIGPSRAFHGDLSPEVRALPDAFFAQNTLAGAGHMSGVGGVACAWAEIKRLKAMRATRRESYHSLGHNSLPVTGFEPVEAHFLSAGGGTGPAHTVHHVGARVRAAEPVDQYIYALAPLTGNGKEYVERAGASAFLLALTLGLQDPDCPAWRARVVPFLYNGAARDYDALAREMARDGLNRLQSLMIEPLVSGERDYQADAAGASRTLTLPDGTTAREIPRCVNVVTVQTIFAPASAWTEKWVSALAADAARYLLGPDGDDAPEAEAPEREATRAVMAEARTLLGRVLSPNERVEVLAEKFYARSNADRSQAAAAWAADSRHLMENNLSALTARRREEAEREAQALAGPGPGPLMAALRRTAGRTTAMAAALREEAQARAAAVEKAREILAWNAAAAGQGQPGQATVLRRAECVLLKDEVAAEVAPALAGLLDDMATRLHEEAEVMEAQTAEAKEWADRLDDECRRREEDYRLILAGGGVRLALAIDDEQYGPGGGRGSVVVPLAWRRALAARVVASRARNRLATEGVATTDFDRMASVLSEEARRATPAPPTIWRILQDETPFLERAARILDAPPPGLDGARLEVYGNARVGRYIEVSSRFHRAVQQVRGLESFTPLDSGDEFELRLRRVDWAVPLMAIDWFRAGREAYAALRDQEGAALRCPLPWREAEVRRLAARALAFDELLFGSRASSAREEGTDGDSGNDGNGRGPGDGPSPGQRGADG